MKPAEPGEMTGLIVAALVFLVVLVVVFMCVQLYYARKGNPDRAGFSPAAGGNRFSFRHDGFLPSYTRPACEDGGCGGGDGPLANARHYEPLCSPGRWPGHRRQCHGLTTGAMPSIDDASPCYGRTCGGQLGVPP